MMMKIYFTFFLLLFFVLLQAQRRDTITKKDCTEIYIAEKLRFHSLMTDFNDVDFTDLNIKIIKNIDKKKFKSQNVIIYLQKQETSCGSEVDFNNCYSQYNFKNNFYNENNFWDEKSIHYLGKDLKLNLIPSIYYFGFGGRYDKYFPENLRKFETLEIKKWNDKGKEYIYFPFNEYSVSVNNSDKIYLEFFNYLQKIIEVKIYYNEGSEPQTVKFQYINNQWNLIKTKKSNPPPCAFYDKNQIKGDKIKLQIYAGSRSLIFVGSRQRLCIPLCILCCLKRHGNFFLGFFPPEGKLLDKNETHLNG